MKLDEKGIEAAKRALDDRSFVSEPSDRIPAAIAAYFAASEPTGPTDEREWTLRWDHRCLHHHVVGPEDGRQMEGLEVVPRSRAVAAEAAVKAWHREYVAVQGYWKAAEAERDRLAASEPTEREKQLEAALREMDAALEDELVVITSDVARPVKLRTDPPGWARIMAARGFACLALAARSGSEAPDTTAQVLYVPKSQVGEAIGLLARHGINPTSEAPDGG